MSLSNIFIKIFALFFNFLNLFDFQVPSSWIFEPVKLSKARNRVNVLRDNEMALKILISLIFQYFVEICNYFLNLQRFCTF